MVDSRRTPKGSGLPLTPARGITVVTPSYAPDVELLADLRESLQAFASRDTRHLVVVPSRDAALFRSRFAGPGCDVASVEEVLPRTLRAVPAVNAWINLRSPWPPLRGWITQQLVKLCIADCVTTDAIVLVDSDVAFVRPITADTFIRDGVVRFYRWPDAVDARLPRHVTWHRVARELLGLPAAPALPLPDYISAMNTWDRRVVQLLRSRVEEVTGRAWADAIGRQLHFSEFILYGVFVEASLQAGHPGQTADPLCHSYWDTTPLGAAAAAAHVAARSPSDVAVMISAKSATPLEVRRRALRTARGAHP
jgi:hypothetical protein